MNDRIEDKADHAENGAAQSRRQAAELDHSERLAANLSADSGQSFRAGGTLKTLGEHAPVRRYPHDLSGSRLEAEKVKVDVTTRFTSLKPTGRSVRVRQGVSFNFPGSCHLLARSRRGHGSTVERRCVIGGGFERLRRKLIRRRISERPAARAARCGQPNHNGWWQGSHPSRCRHRRGKRKGRNSNCFVETAARPPSTPDSG